MTITIDLLRHGEVAGGLRLRGHQDDPLSENGWGQMRAVVAGKTVPWDSITSSPLQRCAHFSSELNSDHCLDVDIVEGFKEISFGDWEGQLISDLYENHPEKISSFWANPGLEPAPNGEDYAAFEERVHAAWAELVSSAEGKHILLVAHGGTIRTLLRQVIHFPLEHFFRIEVPYASLSRITIDEGTPRLTFLNGSL
jgi:alpha-ribazole phosphatase/probable phosphoglycerate mutase